MNKDVAFSDKVTLLNTDLPFLEDKSVTALCFAADQGRDSMLISTFQIKAKFVTIYQPEVWRYRVVQLDVTPENEVFGMLFVRSLSIFTMTSVKQHIEHFNFRCNIQLVHLAL